MIARQHRFHGFNALRHVYGRGQTARGSLFTTKYLLNPRRDSYRVAVVVSRKVHKSAVIRNRIRRRIYEIIRRHAGEFSGVYDIVLSVYSDQIAVMPAAELEKLVVGQLRKAGVMSPSRESHQGPPAAPHDIVKRIDTEERS